jgi:hypothetical protein
MEHHPNLQALVFFIERFPSLSYPTTLVKASIVLGSIIIVYFSSTMSSAIALFSSTRALLSSNAALHISSS